MKMETKPGIVDTPPVSQTHTTHPLIGTPIVGYGVVKMLSFFDQPRRQRGSSSSHVGAEGKKGGNFSP